MVRCSALQLAEDCALAPALATQYPETSKYARRGSELHLEIATGMAVTPEARLALAWLDQQGKVLGKEIPVELLDPETGEVITKGTVDAALETADDIGPVLAIVDFKSGASAYVTDPDRNLQLHAYGIALAQQLGYDRYVLMLAFLREDGVEELRSQVIGGTEQWVMFHRIVAIQGRKPEANPGPWCSDCFQSVVCPSFRERVKLALTLLPSASEHVNGGPLPELTAESAAALVARIDNVKEALEIAEDMAKGYVRRGGQVVVNGKLWEPSMVPGRRTADVEALTNAGLSQFIKAGRPYERWTWRKVAAAKKTVAPVAKTP